MTRELSQAQNLVNIIGSSDIGVISPGASLRSFDRYLDIMRRINMCWAVISYPEEVERWFKKPDIASMMHEPGAVARKDYLIKNQDDLLVVGNLDFLRRQYRYKNVNGNSLAVFIQLCVREKVRRVFLFGADGYSTAKEPYYCKLKIKSRFPRETCYNNHKRDCEEFNRDLPLNTGKHNTKIYNVSLRSKYKIYPRISYKKLFKLIRP